MLRGNGRKKDIKTIKLRCKNKVTCKKSEWQKGENMDFGEKLQNLRKENGLSQEQLAEKLNVSRQAVSKWESGALPDVDNIVKISSFFDCSLDYLLGNGEEKVPVIIKEKELPKWEKKANVAIIVSVIGIAIVWLASKFVEIKIGLYDASSGYAYSQFQKFISVYNLYPVIFALIFTLVVALSVRCLFPIFLYKEKGRKYKSVKCASWILYLWAVVFVCVHLLKPGNFLVWNFRTVLGISCFIGVCALVEMAARYLENERK